MFVSKQLERSLALPPELWRYIFELALGSDFFEQPFRRYRYSAKMDSISENSTAVPQTPAGLRTAHAITLVSRAWYDISIMLLYRTIWIRRISDGAEGLRQALSGRVCNSTASPLRNYVLNVHIRATISPPEIYDVLTLCPRITSLAFEYPDDPKPADSLETPAYTSIPKALHFPSLERIDWMNYYSDYVWAQVLYSVILGSQRLRYLAVWHWEMADKGIGDINTVVFPSLETLCVLKGIPYSRGRLESYDLPRLQHIITDSFDFIRHRILPWYTWDHVFASKARILELVDSSTEISTPPEFGSAMHNQFQCLEELRFVLERPRVVDTKSTSLKTVSIHVPTLYPTHPVMDFLLQTPLLISQLEVFLSQENFPAVSKVVIDGEWAEHLDNLDADDPLIQLTLRFPSCEFKYSRGCRTGHGLGSAP